MSALHVAPRSFLVRAAAALASLLFRVVRWVLGLLFTFCYTFVAGLALGAVVLFSLGKGPQAVDNVSNLVVPIEFDAPSVSTVSDPAVAYLQASSPTSAAGGKVAACSGFFVAPDLVLTAAHCLYPAGVADSVVVFPGVFRDASGVQNPYGACEAVSWDVPSSYEHSASYHRLLEVATWDFALVRLDGCGNSDDLAASSSAFLLGPPPGGDADLPLRAATYPGDQPGQTLMVGAGETLFCMACPGMRLTRTTLDVHQGSSGGVVWVEHEDRRHVVGIVSSTSPAGTFVRDVDGDVQRFVGERLR